MAAFPGQFTYKELLNFDLREQYFWSKKAQTHLLEQRAQQIRASRLANADTANYNTEIQSIQRSLEILKKGMKQKIADDRAALREESKG